MKPPLDNATLWKELRRKSSQLFMQRDFDGAKEAETQALAIAETMPSNGPMLVKGLLALATLHRLQGMNAEAVVLYERALAIAEAQPPNADLDFILHDLAETYRETGRTEDAEALTNRPQSLAQNTNPVPAKKQ